MAWLLILYLSLHVQATPPKSKSEEASGCVRILVDRHAFVWITKSGIVPGTAPLRAGFTGKALRALYAVLRWVPFRNDVLREVPDFRKMTWSGSSGVAYAEFTMSNNGSVTLLMNDLGVMEIKIAAMATASDFRFYENVINILLDSGAHALVTPYHYVEPPSPQDLPGLHIKRLDMNDASTRAGVKNVVKFLMTQ